MDVGLCVLPSSVASTAELARIAEQSGVGWLGVCDSPVLYAEPHAAMQGAIRVTDAIRVGTFVTNPLTRHWSVQAAAFRALDELGPNRAFMGIAPGDSAVHAVGLRPATPTQLADYAGRIREHGPRGLEIMVAAGGPASVRHAARYADHLVIGQGASGEALATLGDIAEQSRRDTEAPALKKWIFLLLNLAEDVNGVERARADIRSAVVAYSRQAFDHTFEGKGVPEALHEPLRELYANYTFDEHSKPGASANARLLTANGREDLEGFLFSRFAAVGTPGQVVEHLRSVVQETGIARVFLSTIASEPLMLARLAGEAVLPELGRLPTTERAPSPRQQSSDAIGT